MTAYRRNSRNCGSASSRFGHSGCLIWLLSSPSVLRETDRGEVQNIIRDNRVYVACQTDDDLPYVLKYSGEDNIVIGSDYGHADTSAEIEALR